jgi:hypothetical protein
MTIQHFTLQRVKKVVFCVVMVVSHAFGLSSYYISSAGNDANDGKSTTAPPGRQFPK